MTQIIDNQTQTALADLARRVTGPVLDGDDPRAADEIVTFNVAVTHRPRVVIGATGTADVAAAVSWAATYGLPVAVQATGHGAVHGVADALLITTTRMRSVEVDPVRRTATVGAGTRWVDVIDASAPYDLAPVSGSSSDVGVVGYSTGGGMGALSREYGFGADQVQAFELVTADGRVRLVDAGTEPDLFWAVRGGKGNFGVVTSMVVGLVPLTTMYAGAVFFPASAVRDVLHSWRTWAPTLPDRASTSIALLNLPTFDEVPEPLRGQHVAMLRFAYDGAAAEGARMLAPMLAAGDVLLSSVHQMRYTEADSIHQDPTEPMPVWEQGVLLRELTAEGVEALLAQAGPDSERALALVEVRLMGGALGRQPRVPNAVAGREGAFSLLALGVLAPDEADRVRAAGAGLVTAMAPWCTGTSVLNWLSSSASREDVARAWRPEVYERLRAIKHEFDPDRMFRFGHAL